MKATPANSKCNKQLAGVTARLAVSGSGRLHTAMAEWLEGNTASVKSAALKAASATADWPTASLAMVLMCSDD